MMLPPVSAILKYYRSVLTPGRIFVFQGLSRFVFHNTDVDSNDERRMQNFVSYGKRFEKILAEV